MTDQTTAAPMRPLGVGEILDAAIKLVRQNLKALAITVLVIGLPAQILSILITSSTTDFCTDALCPDDEVYVYEDEGAYAAGQIANGLIMIFVYLVGQVACYRIIAEGYLGRKVGAAESLRHAARYLFPTILVSILFIIVVGAGTIALIIPGIWLFTALSLSYAALLVEDRRGTKALRRSMDLVKGRWWPVFGLLVLSYLIISVVGFAIGFAVALPIILLIDEASFAALAVEGSASLLANLVTVPFLTAVILVVYFDLRVRKEGFDLALLAERLGGVSAVEHAPPGTVPAPGAPSGGFAPPVPGPPPAPTSDLPAPPTAPWSPPASSPAPPSTSVPPPSSPIPPERPSGTDAFGRPLPPEDPPRG